MSYSKFVCSVVSISIIFFFTACSIPEAEDIDPPRVVILYPYTGSVVSGNILISIESNDDEKVEQVWYFLDGVLMEKSSSASPKFNLNTSPYADNLTHAISAAARDKDGNVGYSDQILIVISDTDDFTPPTVAIVNPSGGQTVANSDTILVVANASDDRIVREVSFFVDGDSVFSDSLYPYQYSWPVADFANAGEHTLLAKAFDGVGNWTLSDGITITVLPSSDDTAPVARLIYPLLGQVLTGIVTVKVDASDNQQLDRVEFFVDGNLVSTINAETTVSPYTYIWDTTPYAKNSEHVLFFKAIDKSGNISVNEPITFTIGSTDITPPIIVQLNPSSELGQVLSGVITVKVDAVDNEELERVEFYVDGVLVQTVDAHTNNSPFTYLWNTTSYVHESRHTLFFKAYDAAGNETSTTPITYTISTRADITPPTIVLLYPLPSITDILTGTVIVALDVTDDVAVTKVEFYIDGGINGDPNYILTNPPWNYSWNTSALADSTVHTLYLKAFDEAGNVGTNGPNAYLID